LTARVDILHPDRPKRIVIVASNPAVSEQTGWPIGFWWAELSHPFWEFTNRGYHVDVASPEGGPLRADSWSDPRDESGYSAEDLISLGFINSPAHMRLVEESEPLTAVRADDYDGALLVGGQGPMYTFFDDERVHALVSSFYQAGKVTAVICHATCVLLKTRLADGRLLVEGKTWTGFATPRSGSPTTSSAAGSSRSGLRTRQSGSRTPTSWSAGASSRMPSATAI
jgi:putative intracellular protease/amidase